MVSERYPKSVRLRRRSDFLDVQRHGRKHQTTHLVVLYLERPGETWRVGIVVSKKVGGSVVRNKVKRWLREVLRQTPTPSFSGDVVLIAKSTILNADVPTLRAEIAGALDRLSRT